MTMKLKESELVTKIAEAQVKRNAVFADIESLRANETKADEEIARLKAELAEEKKPELRHGDYGYTKGNTSFSRFFVKTDGGEIKHYDPKDSKPFSCADPSRYIILGNIFDDLEALSKPLTEFEMKYDDGGDLIKMWHDGEYLKMKQGDFHRVYINIKYLPDFILNLRRVEATPKKESQE